MKPILLLLLLNIISLGANAAILEIKATPVAQVLPWGDFGSTLVYHATDNKKVILFLSDRASWPDANSAARQLAQRGNLVSVLNIDHFFSSQIARRNSCFDIATPLSVYAQDLQQKFHAAHFQKPVLFGAGTAASLVRATLANIPTGIFESGFSLIGNTMPAPLPIPLCRTSGNAQTTANTFHSITVNGMSTPWSAHYLWTDLILVPETLSPNWLNHFEQFTATQQKKDTESVADLPLIELPALATKSSPDFFVLILSGDGGWANIDKDIGNTLTTNGINVVGWNSLEYFWEAKNPDIAARDLTRAINHYRQLWQLDKVVLIGYSMGADVMPFMVTHAREQLRSHILNINLLNPSTSVDFTFHLGGWLNMQAPAPYQLLPEMPGLSGIPLKCIYSEDKESLCPLLPQAPEQKVIHLPGDHHFNGDVATLVRLVLAPE
ncbi:MAG TPA: AcvB/VirJ family lysyl-phosphatidylglycerol hydrolase [Cellvibrio sp.]